MALSGDGGKGYGRRPQLAPNDLVENNWETIFGTKNSKKHINKKDLDPDVNFNKERNGKQ